MDMVAEVYFYALVNIIQLDVFRFFVRAALPMKTLG
jgi:hypothetical protein